MSTAQLVESLLRSVQVGSLYALMAIGLTLTFAVVRLPNFAHAEFITIGAYVALVVSILISGNPLLVVGAAFVVSATVAVLTSRIVYKPLSKRKSSIYTLILSSFAVGLILRYVVFLLAERYGLFDKRIRVPLEVWFGNDWITLTNIFFWVVPTSIGLVVGLSLLLNYTALGRDMRALADNLNLAKVIGIPVDRVQDLTWILAGGLAGVAGALWGIYTWVNPLLGWLAILSVFAATVLGGMNSFTGTILGAYIVGFSENTVMQLLNAWIGLDFSFKPAIPFLIIITVLLFRPQGLTEFSLDLRRISSRRSQAYAD